MLHVENNLSSIDQFITVEYLAEIITLPDLQEEKIQVSIIIYLYSINLSID